MNRFFQALQTRSEASFPFALGKPMDVKNVEEILTTVATAQDSETLRNATSALNTQVYASAECIPAFVQIICTSPHFQVRQLAAVELRKRISKWWLEIDDNTRAAIRTQLLQVVLTEENKLVRHAISRAISSIARIDVPENKWPDLLNFLNQASASDNVNHREVGLYCIYTLFEVIAEFFMNQTGPLFELLSKTIADPESNTVRVTTVLALGKMSEYIDPEDKNNVAIFKNLIPSMVNVLEVCLKESDSKSAGDIFEVFDGLFMMETPFLSEYLGDLIQFIVNVSSTRELEDSMRNMALSSLMWATLYKQNKIRNLKLVGLIVERLMPIGTEEDPEDIDEDSPSRLAFRVLNAVASNMPPQQIVPIVMPLVMEYMQNPDPQHRKAAMMGFAVIIEGCAEYMRPKLAEILPVVCSGLQDPEIIVRRAACITLSCLAEDLPDIAEHHQVVMPLVFNLLSDASPDVTKHACNALDSMLEGLDTDILQYLPNLMEKLVWLLDHADQTETKATAIGAIGSAAHAAGEAFQPYFGEVLPRIRNFMSAKTGNDETLLRGVATDTAGAIAEAVGADMFRPFTQEFMNLAIEQLQLESPRLRECAYAFFSIISGVFGEEFAPFLPTIMPAILASCKQEETNEPALETEIDLTLGGEDEDEEEDDLSALNNINSAVADEKEFAADALGELFENTRSHFLPYVEEAVQALLEATANLFDGVRKASLGSLFAFLKTFYTLSSPGDWVPGVPVNYPVHENVQKMITLVMPTVLTMWSDEDDRMVVVQICQEMIQALKRMGPCIVADHVEEVSNRIHEIFEKKSVCQETYDVEDTLDEDEEVESESLLIGAAADLVAALCEAVGEGYASYFNVFLPLISKYYKPTKSETDRLMATGCLGECVVGLKGAVTPHTEALLHLFLKGSNDEDEAVRSNSAFALGVLVSNTQIDLSSQYPTILAALYPLFQNQTLPGTTDNASGAVARLITAHTEAVPLEQVLPVFLNALPLKADFAENEPVFNCLFHLFRSNNGFVLGHIPQFLPIFTSVLSNEGQLKDDTRNQLVELIRALNSQSPDLNIGSTELGRFL